MNTRGPIVVDDNHGNGIASAVPAAERQSQWKFIMHTNRRTCEPEPVCICQSPATPDSINATLIGAAVIAVHLVISFSQQFGPWIIFLRPIARSLLYNVGWLGYRLYLFENNFLWFYISYLAGLFPQKSGQMVRGTFWTVWLIIRNFFKLWCWMYADRITVFLEFDIVRCLVYSSWSSVIQFVEFEHLLRWRIRMNVFVIESNNPVEFQGKFIRDVQRGTISV